MVQALNIRGRPPRVVPLHLPHERVRLRAPPRVGQSAQHEGAVPGGGHHAEARGEGGEQGEAPGPVRPPVPDREQEEAVGHVGRVGGREGVALWLWVVGWVGGWLWAMDAVGGRGSVG